MRVINLDVSSTVEGFDCAPFQNGTISGWLVCQGQRYTYDNLGPLVSRKVPLLLFVTVSAMVLVM